MGARHSGRGQVYPPGQQRRIHWPRSRARPAPSLFSASPANSTNVRLAELEASLVTLGPAFPLPVRDSARRVFWHYLDPVDSPPHVEAEARYPPVPCAMNGRPLVRVTAYGRA
jgi:hypothetical protein